MNKHIIIKVEYDAQHKRWLGSSDDISGLHVECGSIEELLEVVADALPDLIEHNLDLPMPPHPLYDIVTSNEARLH